MESRYLEAYLREAQLSITPEDEAELCKCFQELLPTLKPEYAELIEALELSPGDPEQVADKLDISRNNLKVRRHRARQALRQRLEETCRTCATHIHVPHIHVPHGYVPHGCLDCSCRSTSGELLI